jgi:hypothetical protein
MLLKSDLDRMLLKSNERLTALGETANRAGGAAIESHIGCKPLHRDRRLAILLVLGWVTMSVRGAQSGPLKSNLYTHDEQHRTGKSSSLGGSAADG